jgi:hypothetical protein
MVAIKSSIIGNFFDVVHSAEIYFHGKKLTALILLFLDIQEQSGRERKAPCHRVDRERY